MVPQQTTIRPNNSRFIAISVKHVVLPPLSPAVWVDDCRLIAVSVKLSMLPPFLLTVWPNVRRLVTTSVKLVAQLPVSATSYMDSCHREMILPTGCANRTYFVQVSYNLCESIIGFYVCARSIGRVDIRC